MLGRLGLIRPDDRAIAGMDIGAVNSHAASAKQAWDRDGAVKYREQRHGAIGIAELDTYSTNAFHCVDPFYVLRVSQQAKQRWNATTKIHWMLIKLWWFRMLFPGEECIERAVQKLLPILFLLLTV